ncbi:MAG: HEAT repeat domain-containing protein, partial [Myxococcota bacterium]
WRELATFDRRHIDALLALTDDFEMVSDCCLWLLLLTDQELPPDTDLDNVALYWDSGDRCATAFARIQTTLLLIALDHGRSEHCDHFIRELYTNDISWLPWLAVLEPDTRRRCLDTLLDTAFTVDVSEYNPYICTALMHARLTLTTSWPVRWDSMLTQSIRYVAQYVRSSQMNRWPLQPLEEQLHGLLCALPEPRRIAVLANVGQDPCPTVYHLSTAPIAENARWIVDQLALAQGTFPSIASQRPLMSHTLGAVEAMGEVLHPPLCTWPPNRMTPSIARLMRLCANGKLLPTLLNLLAHEQHDIRLEAARGIAWLGPEQAQEPLLDFWRSNTVWPQDTSHSALTEGLAVVHCLWAGSAQMHKTLSIPDELPESLRHRMETLQRHPTGWFMEEETLWRAVLHTAAAPLPLPNEEDKRDSKHVRFLSEQRRLFQSNAKVCWNSDMFDAWGHDPQATVATLELGLALPSEATRKGRHDHLRDTLKAAPPQTAASLLTHRLMTTAHLAAPYTLYAVLCGLKAETPDALHEAMLEHESQLIRDLASEMLAQRPSALTRVPALLTHRLATVRASAAYCLQRAGTEAACDPLREALSREQTQSVRKAITTALAVLDPDQYSYRGDPHRPLVPRQRGWQSHGSVRADAPARR